MKLLKKNFIKYFVNNEIDISWIDFEIVVNEKYLVVFEEVKLEIICCISKLCVIEESMGLSIEWIKDINCCMSIGEVKVCCVKKEMVEVNLCFVILIVKKYINCGL